MKFFMYFLFSLCTINAIAQTPVQLTDVKGGVSDYQYYKGVIYYIPSDKPHEIWGLDLKTNQSERKLLADGNERRFEVVNDILFYVAGNGNYLQDGTVYYLKKNGEFKKIDLALYKKANPNPAEIEGGRYVRILPYRSGALLVIELQLKKKGNWFDSDHFLFEITTRNDGFDQFDFHLKEETPSGGIFALADKDNPGYFVNMMGRRDENDNEPYETEPNGLYKYQRKYGRVVFLSNNPESPKTKIVHNQMNITGLNACNAWGETWLNIKCDFYDFGYWSGNYIFRFSEGLEKYTTVFRNCGEAFGNQLFLFQGNVCYFKKTKQGLQFAITTENALRFGSFGGHGLSDFVKFTNHEIVGNTLYLISAHRANTDYQCIWEFSCNFDTAKYLKETDNAVAQFVYNERISKILAEPYSGFTTLYNGISYCTNKYLYKISGGRCDGFNIGTNPQGDITIFNTWNDFLILEKGFGKDMEIYLYNSSKSELHKIGSTGDAPERGIFKGKNLLVLNLTNANSNKIENWVSDGTHEGTHILGPNDFIISASSVTVAEKKMFFMGLKNPDNKNIQLYSMDL